MDNMHLEFCASGILHRTININLKMGQKIYPVYKKMRGLLERGWPWSKWMKLLLLAYLFSDKVRRYSLIVGQESCPNTGSDCGVYCSPSQQESCPNTSSDCGVYCSPSQQESCPNTSSDCGVYCSPSQQATSSVFTASTNGVWTTSSHVLTSIWLLICTGNTFICTGNTFIHSQRN